MAAVQKPRGGAGVISDEDYWGESGASFSRVRNIFDENVDLDTTKRILRNQVFDDDTECDEDVINWDGSANRNEEIKSARYRAPVAPQNSRISSQQRSSPQPSNESGRLSMSGRYDSSVSSPSLPSQQSIDDNVVREKQQPTWAEISKLKAENNLLRRNLESAKEERKPTPRETVNKMIMGQKYTLEKYKSREEKVQLLEEALSVSDGNAIIATLLFMRDTVKPAIFNLELMKRPVATEHYIFYLRQQTETDALSQLIDILGMLGRTEEAAMLKFKQAVKPLNLENKKKVIQNCLGAHFQTEPTLAFEASVLWEQIQLIETQIPVDSNDSKTEQNRFAPFKDGHRLQLLETPVISTLHYCCLYHYDEKEGILSSPIAIRNKHGLTEKQFIWTAIRARGKLKQWSEVAKLFETRGWLGGTKMKSVIGFDRVLSLLKDLDAPRSEMNKYCNLVDGLDRRLEVGLKFGCCESVIETYKQMRDRQQLQIYEATLTPNSPEQFHAAGVLRDPTIKWKN